MRERFLAALVGLALCATAAHAQIPGDFPAGNIYGNPTGSAAPGRVTTPTAILDQYFGSTRGAILERGASGWVPVTPGISGLPFVSAGAGADPGYALLGLSGGGSNNGLTASNGGIVWSDATKLNILAGTATANLPLLSGATATPAWAAITYPTSANSGGVAYFSSATAMASSAAGAANA